MNSPACLHKKRSGPHDASSATSFTSKNFGLVGALLTCVGLYGLMSYRIERRTQEIGVRMALGAGRFRVVRLVMGQSFGLVFTGLAIGLASSLAINQIIRSFFFGVTLYDPPTILAVVALLIAVTAIAAFVPARRASRVDPTVALRYE